MHLLYPFGKTSKLAASNLWFSQPLSSAFWDDWLGSLPGKTGKAYYGHQSSSDTDTAR